MRLCVIIADVDTDIKKQWRELVTILSRSNLRQSAIALEAGVNQSAVSRVLAECPKRNGTAFKKLCIYANMRESRLPQESTEPIANRALASAIREVWNGTPEHAQALAAMIRAAGRAAEVSFG